MCVGELSPTEIVREKYHDLEQRKIKHECSLFSQSSSDTPETGQTRRLDLLSWLDQHPPRILGKSLFSMKWK